MPGPAASFLTPRPTQSLYWPDPPLLQAKECPEPKTVESDPLIARSAPAVRIAVNPRHPSNLQLMHIEKAEEAWPLLQAQTRSV